MGPSVQRLLSDVYLERRCNVCGEIYPLTLYEILLEQRAETQWQSPRPQGETGVGYEGVLHLVPKDQLEALAEAWDRLFATLESNGLTPHIGTPPPHVHTDAGAHPDAGHH